jgi:hypothetical protein
LGAVSAVASGAVVRAVMLPTAYYVRPGTLLRQLMPYRVRVFDPPARIDFSEPILT